MSGQQQHNEERHPDCVQSGCRQAFVLGGTERACAAGECSWGEYIASLHERSAGVLPSGADRTCSGCGNDLQDVSGELRCGICEAADGWLS